MRVKGTRTVGSTHGQLTCKLTVPTAWCGFRHGGRAYPAGRENVGFGAK